MNDSVQKIIKFGYDHFIASALCLVVDQFGSVELKVWEVMVMIIFHPLSASCIRIASHASSLAFECEGLSEIWKKDNW